MLRPLTKNSNPAQLQRGTREDTQGTSINSEDAALDGGLYGDPHFIIKIGFAAQSVLRECEI